MSGNSKIRLIEKCGSNLNSETATILADAGAYYQLNGTFSNGSINGFSLNANGAITYTGAGGTFLFNGASDLKSDKVAEITYALFCGGINTGKTTPIQFNHANAYIGIGITGLVDLENGDILTVRAKSDTANTTITVFNLRVTFWGE